MKTIDFIKQVSDETKQELSLVQNRNYPSMGSVFWNGQQICSVPFNDIFEEHNAGYSNEAGYPHRNIATAKAMILSFIDRWNNEEGFKETLTESL